MIDLDNVEISFFSKERRVIPLYYKIGSFSVTNIKLPDIIIHNKSDEQITLSKITILGLKKYREIISFNLYEKDLEETIKIVVPQINNLIKEQNIINPLLLTFGKTKLINSELSQSHILESGETTLIPLSLMLFFHHISLNPIDNLQINFTVNNESDQKVKEVPIELFSFKVTENYLFPLKGNICICNLPMNLSQHRKAQSQEFAIDIVGSDFLTSSTTTSMKVSDYSIFGDNVMSIGDGTVVEIGDKFPDSEMDKPKSYSEDFFIKLSNRMVPIIGVKNTMLGNYVIIEHKSKEFSVYAHLRENSLCVKKGDKVKQGNIIAKVGNTGHSTEPHLHFQLIDSINVFKANGLPIMFNNLPIREMNQHFSNSNSLINSDYFYVHID